MDYSGLYFLNLSQVVHNICAYFFNYGTITTAKSTAYIYLQAFQVNVHIAMISIKIGIEYRLLVGVVLCYLMIFYADVIVLV